MKIFNARKRLGFTLIEIIIVVVILGILAAVALPKIVNNIDKARAAEAFQVASTVSGAFHRCVDEQTGGLGAATSGDVAACGSFANLNITDPTASSANFTYIVWPWGPTSIRLIATGKFSGAAGTDTVMIDVNGVTGASTKTCDGRFTTMCKN